MRIRFSIAGQEYKHYSENDFDVLIWENTDGLADLAYQCNKDTDADQSIITVFYWQNDVHLNGKKYRLMKTVTGVQPVAKGITVAISASIPCTANDIDHIKIELVKIREAKEIKIGDLK